MSRREQQDQPPVEEAGKGPEKMERRRLDEEMQDVGGQRLEAIKSGFRSFKEGFVARFRGLKGGMEKAVKFVIAPDVAVKRGADVTREAAVDAKNATVDFAGRQVEAGKQKVEAARDWTVATGTAARDKAVETGQSIKQGLKTGGEFAIGATAYGIEQGVKGAKSGVEAIGRKGTEISQAARLRAEKAVQRGHEVVGAGKEWVVDRAADIHDRAVDARDRFTSRVEALRADFKSRLEQQRAQREEKQAHKEYQSLIAMRDTWLSNQSRFQELESRFGGQPAE